MYIYFYIKVLLLLFVIIDLFCELFHAKKLFYLQVVKNLTDFEKMSIIMESYSELYMMPFFNSKLRPNLKLNFFKYLTHTHTNP